VDFLLVLLNFFR